MSAIDLTLRYAIILVAFHLACAWVHTFQSPWPLIDAFELAPTAEDQLFKSLAVRFDPSTMGVCRVSASLRLGLFAWEALKARALPPRNAPSNPQAIVLISPRANPAGLSTMHVAGSSSARAEEGSWSTRSHGCLTDGKRVRWRNAAVSDQPIPARDMRGRASSRPVAWM